MTKFCVDCAWQHKPLFGVNQECTLPGAVLPNPVTGYTAYPLCWIAKLPENRCGPEGKCWEPKPTFWQRFVARFKA